MKFGIWCEVRDGVTGSRAAWLKKDGEDWVLETLSEAEKLADQLRGNLVKIDRPARTANFAYTVRIYS